MQYVNSDFLYFIIYNFQLFLVIFSRVIGFFTSAPIFGGALTLNQYKFSLALLISFIIFPVIKQAGYTLPTDLMGLVGLIAENVFIGLSFGFFLYLIFSTLQLSAYIFSVNMGLGFTEVVDPLAQIEIPSWGNLLLVFSILIFLRVDAHIFMIEGLIYSFKKIWAIGYILSKYETVGKAIVSAFITMLEVAFRVSLPIVGVLLLIDIVLGIVYKMAPQINVMIMGFDIKMLVGFFIIWFVSPSFFTLYQDVVMRAFYNLEELIKVLV